MLRLGWPRNLVVAGRKVEMHDGEQGQGLPETKAGKNRMHLDIAVDDQEAEISRLQELGARRIDEGVQSFGEPDGSECRTRSRTSLRLKRRRVVGL